MSQNFILFLAELYGLCLLLLVLHRLSSHYGIAGFLFVLAAVVSVLQGPGTNAVFFETDFLRFMLSPTVLVPCVLMSVLVVYAVDGTSTARLVIGGVLLTSLASLIIVRVLSLHLELPGSGTIVGDSSMLLQAKPSWRLVGSSLTALTVSMISMLVCYQYLANLLGGKAIWVGSGIALMVGLAVDGHVFSLCYLGSFTSKELVSSKLVSACLLWPAVALYLRNRGFTVQRRPMDVLMGSYAKQDLRLQDAHEARRVAQLRLNTVVGNTPLILFSLNEYGEFTWLEGAGLKRLNHQNEDLLQRPIRLVFAHATHLIDQALKGKDQDGLVTSGDRTFELCLRPRFSATGKLIEIDGVATDVTESRQIELALRASENRFQATFEQAAVGLAIIDETGAFLRVNQRLCELLGYSEEEVLQRALPDTLKAEIAPEVCQRLVDLQRGREPNMVLETQMLANEGQVLETVLSVSSVRDEQQKFDYMIVVVEDITARKQAERELSEAQKLKVLGELTGGIAHDFNNLLTIVMGGLEIALEDIKDQKLKDILEPAFRATARGADLTQQLLAYARRQPLKAESLQLQPLLQDMRGILERTLPSDIAVTLDVAANMHNCFADYAQLQNVLLNLSLNARDAMPGGGNLDVLAYDTEVEAGTELELDPGHYVVLEVADTGNGMSEEVLQRVYEPFYTTKDIGKGSGLGLSMVYGFVKQSSGTIVIDSAVGEGTRVKIYLPADTSKTASDQPESEDETATYGRGGIVLVVEDDPEVSNLVCRQLERLAYTPIAVTTGQEGIDKLELGPRPDLLITDVMLAGGVDGVAVTERALELYPDLGIICMSGYSRDVLQSGHKLADSITLLSKPFRVQTLAEYVERAMQR